MTSELKKLIEISNEICGKIFNEDGEIIAMYHLIRADGDHLIISPPPTANKELAIKLIRLMFQEANVIRYVFIDQVWMLRESKYNENLIDKYQKEGISNHPDRIEAILFLAEDQNKMLAASREIIRTGKKPRLGELNFMETRTMEGRIIGLLTPQGTMQ